MLTFAMLLPGLIPADGLVASSGRRLPRQLQHAPAAERVQTPWMQTSDSDSDSDTNSNSDSQPLGLTADLIRELGIAVGLTTDLIRELGVALGTATQVGVGKPGEDSDVRVKHVVRFEHATKSGMEDCSTTVSSQDEFSTLLTSGAQMWAVNITTSKRIDAIVSLDQALAVQDAADPEVVLRYYGSVDPSRLDNLESYRDDCATGLEQSCTRGVAHSGFMRPLTVLNDGHSVKFQSKTTDGGLDDIIEVDGLLLNHEAVVMNEVKNSPSLKKVQKVRSRARTLLGVVTELMFAPDDIVTDPACVKNEIVNWLATVNKTMVLDRGVVPVMSGSNFAPDVEEECRKRKIYVCRSNGADWSVSR